MAMTEEHKQALAQGRAEARAVKNYLEALQNRKPGRPVNRESLEKRLATINDKLASETNPLQQVELVQTRLDVEAQLAEFTDQPDSTDLERAFIDQVKSYSERKDITYTAWREVGVPASILKTAGIKETRRR